MSSTRVNRTPAGVTSGGQFAPRTGAESSITLSAETEGLGWSEAGFDQHHAAQWSEAGYTPLAAKTWTSQGYDSPAAADFWAQRGFNAFDARAWEAEALPPPPDFELIDHPPAPEEDDPSIPVAPALTDAAGF